MKRANTIERSKVLAGHLFVEATGVSLKNDEIKSLKLNPQAAKVGLGKGGKGCPAASRGKS